MAQKKILVDSNSYFRIAEDIHPLLDVEFGPNRVCLYVLQELEDEWYRSSRLGSIFPWVSERMYVENRRKEITVSRAERRAIDQTEQFMFEHSKASDDGPLARTDILYVAYGRVLEVPVVTDDVDMRELASDFGVASLSTLDLMKMLCEMDELSTHKVQEVISKWIRMRDCPANFPAEMREYFPMVDLKE